jgi:hypothetical protein
VARRRCAVSLGAMTLAGLAGVAGPDPVAPPTDPSGGSESVILESGPPSAAALVQATGYAWDESAWN